MQADFFSALWEKLKGGWGLRRSEYLNQSKHPDHQVEPVSVYFSPKKKPFDPDEQVYPSGALAEYWSEFLKRREMLTPFENQFAAEFQAADWGAHYHFSTELKKRVGRKTIRIVHRESELDDGLFHLQSCSKRNHDNLANGWEYWYTGNIRRFRDDLTNYLLANSPTLVEIIGQEQGMWWRYFGQKFSGAFGPKDVSLYENPDHLTAEEYDLLWKSEGIVFELLVPGFYSRLLKTAQKNRVSVRRTRGNEEQRLDELAILRQLVLVVAEGLNEKRPHCPHFDEISCLLCGRKSKPDLIHNLSMNLPNEICAWCVKVIDYHDQPLFEAGKTPGQIRSEGINGFQLAVSWLDFPYWRSPTLSRKLIQSLNLRNQSAIRVRELSSVLASMPRHLCGYESDLHFLKAAGLEQISQPHNGRGKKTISSCDHLCLSMGEREICEYLNARGVPHDREPVYGELAEGEISAAFGAMRGDFLVGQTVIEYAGMSGNADYDEKMDLKIALCASFGVDLIVIYPNELGDLEAKLNFT